MEKYTGYSALDFVNDERFLRWQANPTQNENDYWYSLLENYPEKKSEVKEAILLFKLLHTPEFKLEINESYELWNRILKKSNKSVSLKIINLMKYAAVFILVFLTGAASYYFYQNSYQDVQYQLASEDIIRKSKAMIILSDGTKVSLDNQSSRIAYSNNGENLVINNDTIKQQIGKLNEQLNKLIIPFGNKSKITLSDGSKVWLNAGSQLTYPAVFNEKLRKVSLIGEAYFDIAKDLSRPFIVNTNDINIKVVGTKFDISSYPDDKFVHAVLEEGKIILNYNNTGKFGKSKLIEMNPNQMVEINRVTGESKSRIVDVGKYISWKDGMLEFDKLDLNRALIQVERYYNVRIHLADPLIGSFKISGKLDLKDEPEQVMNVIKLTVPIDWQKKSNGDFLIINKTQ